MAGLKADRANPLAAYSRGMGWVVALLGACVGTVFSVALTILVARADPDALVWVASWFFFSFILIPTGAGVALLVRRRRKHAGGSREPGPREPDITGPQLD